MNPKTRRITPRRISKDIISDPQTTQIIARPLDIYVKPNLNFEGSSSGERRANLLKSIVGDVARIAGHTYNQNAKEDYIKGRQDANARLEMDKEYDGGFLHSKESYENGYRATEDEAKAIYMQSSYLEALEQNNYFLDDANPRDRMDELYKQIYSQTVTPEYLYSNNRDGVMSEVGVLAFKNALIAGEEAFNKAYVEDRKLKLTNATKVVYKDNLSKLYANGQLNVDSISATALDIEQTNLASEGGGFITEQEYTTMMIDSISELALDEINRGDFKKADTLLSTLKGAYNAQGIKWYDQITSTDAKSGKQVYGFKDNIDELEVAILRAKEDYRKASEEARKKWQDDNLTKLTLATIKLSNIDDPLELSKQTNELNKLVETYVRNGAVDASKGLKLFDNLQDLKNNEGYPQESKGEAYREAYYYVQGVDANFNDFMEQFKYRLSKADLSKLINELQQNQDKLSSSGIKKQTATLSALNSGVEYIEKILGARTIDNKIKDILDPHTAKLVSRLNRQKNDFIMEYANKGSIPTSKEVNDFLDELEDKYANIKKGGEGDAKRDIKTRDFSQINPTNSNITKGKFDNWK